ncbi:tRNA pseudouridine(38-40) synthase TruA [Nocardioidaceae bacterium]|nr:tRNA pseudouridine(38-40) synthase TruA [Nocardioidaceae bacterium]
MRLRMDLAYDGTDFHGWAAQPGLRTVQGELEAGLATVLRVPEVAVTCAGRTDAGVHARGQVVHVDVDRPVLEGARGRGPDDAPTSLRRRLHGVLPADVRVHDVQEAPPGFDARFGALWRRYAYRVADAGVRHDPLTRGHVLAWPRPLDLDLLDEAASRLVGEHDFAAFCKRREGATTIRRLLELRWERDAAGVATATVRADAFCHSMVRALVGCLLVVGEGNRPPEWAGQVLAAGVRDPAVRVAPAHGLTLEEVRYPDDDELAAQAERARVVRTLPPTQDAQDAQDS